MNQHKIAVGISGGVDSAVAALRLKQQGYDVLGIFMQNWVADRDDPYCTAEQDLSDSRAICDQIGIPLFTVNFSQAYWDRVFKHCLDEFAQGRTPNPDIGCNREIKFDLLWEYASSLGAEKLATGHYARIQKDGDHYRLQKAIDTEKDQTYFLYTLGALPLARSLFPIGDLTKSDVRALAKAEKLINHDKKDSTGICFIGERKFKTFLAEFLLAQPGDIENTAGSLMGKHDGIMFYTIGQRKGLHIGGSQHSEGSPWYVVDKIIDRNVLVVAQGHDHPRLFSSELRCEQVHWIDGKIPHMPFECRAKTRYRQPEQRCTVSASHDGDSCMVQFEVPQWAITPGQSIVFYDDRYCLGGGIIY